MHSHLGALIEQQQRLNGLSYADIVARANQRGEKLGKSNVGRVARGENPSLSRATILGLAAGLGVTPATVARAALADMDIVLTEPEADAETAIRSDPTLSDQGRQILLATLAGIRTTATETAQLKRQPEQGFIGMSTAEDIAIARDTVTDS
jgi:transcriptional regulator with XRE-family HTH domain